MQRFSFQHHLLLLLLLLWDVVGERDARDDCRDGGDSVKWAGLQCGGARPRRLSAIFCRQKIRRRRAAAVSTRVVCVGWVGGGVVGRGLGWGRVHSIRATQGLGLVPHDYLTLSLG